MEESEKPNKTILERARGRASRLIATLQIPLQLAMVNPKLPNNADVDKDAFPDPIVQVDEETPRSDATLTTDKNVEDATNDLEKSTPDGYAYIDYNIGPSVWDKITGEDQTHNIDSLITGEERVFNLSEMAAHNQVVELSRKDVKKLNAAGKSLEYTWYASDAHQADQEIIVDNLAGFIAVDGQKVLKWRANGNSGPKIYGMPTVDGELRKDVHVPLSRRAVKADALNHLNYRNQDNLLAYLEENNAIPPAGQRLWDLKEFPKASEDLRDISNFTRQQESRKLLLNMLRFQPELPEGHEYDLKNNLRLVRLAMLESKPALQIGPDPHIYSFRGNLRRHKTPDTIGRISFKTGSYAGLGQFNVTKPEKTAIAGTPFIDKKTGEWTGFEIAGDSIKTAEDFLNSPMAQTYALFYTQDKYAQIKRSGSHPTGVAAVAHLLGSHTAKHGNYVASADGNGTTASTYYNVLKNYPYQTLAKELHLDKDPQLGNGLNPELVKITAEGQAKFDAAFLQAHQDTLSLVQQAADTTNLQERDTLLAQADKLRDKFGLTALGSFSLAGLGLSAMPNTLLSENPARRPRKTYDKEGEISLAYSAAGGGGDSPPEDAEALAEFEYIARREEEEEELLSHETDDTPLDTEPLVAVNENTPQNIVDTEITPPSAPPELFEEPVAEALEEISAEEITANELLPNEELVEETVVEEAVNEPTPDVAPADESTIEPTAEPVAEESPAIEAVEDANKDADIIKQLPAAALVPLLPEKAKSLANKDIDEAAADTTTTESEQGSAKTDTEDKQQAAQYSMTSKAVAMGSALAIPLTAKHFFAGKKNPETQKRERPTALKILAGAAVIGLTAFIAHKTGAMGWVTAEAKRRLGGSSERSL